MRRLRGPLVMMAVLLLTGCSLFKPDPLHQQAFDALARWDAAVAEAGAGPGFVPVGPITTQAGVWEPEVAANNKLALIGGRLTLSGVDSSATIPDPKVVWASGEAVAVQTVTVGAAIQRIGAEGAANTRCEGCQPLEVIAARAVTADVETSRGPATAPAWEFTIAGTQVRVIHVAVAPDQGIHVTPPPWDSYNARGGIMIDRAGVDASGQRLTVSFTGAPKPATEPCGVDYTGEAVENHNAAVVIVHPHAHGANEVCTLMGAARETTVDLAKPLGERAVLEVVNGTAVSVTHA